MKNSKRALLILLSVLIFQDCGGNCSVLSRVFDEPSCHALGLNAGKTLQFVPAACTGAPASRKVSLSCPPSAGSSSQCTSTSNHYPVFIVLVLNNSAGSFIDASGTYYSSCGPLWSDLFNGKVQNVKALFISGANGGSDQLTCTNAGCSLPVTSGCLAGWDQDNRVQKGTADLPTGSDLLACVYIDNSSEQSAPPPIAVGRWDGAFKPVHISGNLDFSTGWVDAF